MQGYGPKQEYSKFRNSIDRKKRASLSSVLFFEHRVEKCSKIFPMGYDIYMVQLKRSKLHLKRHRKFSFRKSCRAKFEIYDFYIIVSKKKKKNFYINLSSREKNVDLMQHLLRVNRIGV